VAEPLSPTSNDGVECALLSCSEQTIWAELALWREDELSILGRMEADIFLVKGDSDAIDTLGSLVSVRIIKRNVEVPSQHLSIDPKAIISHPRFPILSAHLNEVMEQHHWGHVSYWENISNQSFRSDTALQTMESLCDVIVHLGLTPSHSSRTTVLRSGSLNELLADLFVAGCSIDWNLVATPGLRERLPAYLIADPLI